MMNVYIYTSRLKIPGKRITESLNMLFRVVSNLMLSGKFCNTKISKDYRKHFPQQPIFQIIMLTSPHYDFRAIERTAGTHRCSEEASLT